jgi:hypothetical protein
MLRIAKKVRNFERMTEDEKVVWNSLPYEAKREYVREVK